MSEKQMKIVGWIATFMSIMMYVSYIPQIMNNLQGNYGNPIQPLTELPYLSSVCSLKREKGLAVVCS